MEALFERDGEWFLPSEYTRGGWTDHHQHGGPPAGLLARAVEAASPDMWTARLTFDLIRPVPMGPLTCRTTIAKDGRNVRVVDSALVHEGVDVAWVRALQIRKADVSTPHTEHEWEHPPAPTGLAVAEWRERWGPEMTRFHIDGVEIRSVDSSFESLGPGVAWFRMTVPLVAGEPTTPVQRLATISDMANGVSRELDFAEFSYINADITLYIHRLPVDEWVGIAGRSHPRSFGVGVNEATVFDADGPIGHIGQAQILSTVTTTPNF